jgi:hypothetical protein
MKETQNDNKILVGKPQWKGSLEKCGFRWKGNIKMG